MPWTQWWGPQVKAIAIQAAPKWEKPIVRRLRTISTIVIVAVLGVDESEHDVRRRDSAHSCSDPRRDSDLSHELADYERVADPGSDA